MPRLLAQTELVRNAPSTRHCLVGEARKKRLLYMADVGAHAKSSARSVPRLECLYDVVASVHSALGKLLAHVCDCALGASLKAGWCRPHSTCSIPSLPLSATATKPVPSHSHVTAIFLSIFLTINLVPTNCTKALGFVMGTRQARTYCGTCQGRAQPTNPKIVLRHLDVVTPA
jgi:hypothetical protein